MGGMKLLPLLLIATAAPLLPAENDNAYRVDFTIRETANQQPAKIRHYQIAVDNLNWGTLSAGTKVPYAKEKDKFSFVEAGITIRCRVVEQADHLRLDAVVDISSIATPGQLPTIQSLRTDVAATAPLGQSIELAKLEDPASDRTYDIAATVTRQK
jgi:hypothetical protein